MNKTIYLKDKTVINITVEIFFYPEGIRFGNKLLSKEDEIAYSLIECII